MAKHELDLPTWRLLFPAFADPADYPDAYISAKWDMATAQIFPWDNCLIAGDRLQTALNLLTAHLVQLDNAIRAGGSSAAVGPLASASIDKVAVSLVAPPIRNGWQYWLASTPYGQQLWALLRAAAAPGFMIGGSRERSAFRKVGGRF